VHELSKDHWHVRHKVAELAAFADDKPSNEKTGDHALSSLKLM